MSSSSNSEANVGAGSSRLSTGCARPSSRVDAPGNKTPLLGLSLAELSDLFIAMGEKPYRAKQLYDAIYRRRITDVSRITSLPASLRADLAQRTVVTGIGVENVFDSSDG